MIDGCPRFRIGLSQALMTSNFFQFFKIPVPTTCQFRDYSGTFSQSDGGAVQHGYATVTMLWNNLRSDQAFFLKEFVNGALGDDPAGTGILYMTVLKNNADDIGRRYIDVSGVPHPLEINEAGTLNGSVGLVVYENVRLFLNDVTIINDPASF